jgi:hypothetical protein
MSKTVFSNALFEQMGGVNWSIRPGHFAFHPHNNDDTVECKPEQAVSALSVDIALDSEGITEQSSDDANPLKENSDIHIDRSEQKTVIEKPLVDALSLSSNVGSNIVVLGAGLDGFWQNDETLAWQLWQNIMLAFDWDESRMTFFDTSHLVSEEMIFTTMEEIIGLGVDWVLTMDDEHPISEQLVEGVHVVSVPDLESMLSDPYAKQSFYHAVIELNNQF